jgi:hypothetical protein
VVRRRRRAGVRAFGGGRCASSHPSVPATGGSGSDRRTRPSIVAASFGSAMTTVPHLAQRFAIDWVKMDARGEYARDHRGRRNTDWYGYGEPVLAVADARVVAVMDSIPDNTPGERLARRRDARSDGPRQLCAVGPRANVRHDASIRAVWTSEAGVRCECERVTRSAWARCSARSATPGTLTGRTSTFT